MPRSHHLLAAAVAAVVVVVMGWSVRPCEASLYQPPPPAMAYHDGAVLEGAVPVSVLYYGAFPPHHRAVVADFLMSLSPRGRDHQPHTFGAPGPAPPPTVARWWGTVERYVRKAGRGGGAGVARVVLASQVDDEGCSLGRRLSRAQVERLAARLGVAPGGVAVVLTAADVAVEGFCSSACGAHGSSAPGGGAVHVWVGDASAQCPGRCAWPFHAADYGDADAGRHRRAHGHDVALRAPNGDAGVDGVVINLAALMAGAVTNPYGRGYFQGDAAAPVEVAGACPGVYGRGAYPGYPGAVRVDAATGAGYNVVGRNGRRYLVPALVDPDNYSCLIMT
ncbi:protein PHOSPHATE-INDUCED 1 homolog [Oryza glaberrima]|uniref:protein PHOSPHATE-INDUCED 1 homolog n=1 Tax=Oryza glaberrima TaxID=4538 RepID=UPI00224BFBF1|nr:protein PHOSPHATE-INDUCED 1 homolog [Oryza glaberrima]